MTFAEDHARMSHHDLASRRPMRTVCRQQRKGVLAARSAEQMQIDQSPMCQIIQTARQHFKRGMRISKFCAGSILNQGAPNQTLSIAKTFGIEPEGVTADCNQKRDARHFLN